MTDKEALTLALEALIWARAFIEGDAPVEVWSVNDKAITAIKEALAQPEQEPVVFNTLSSLKHKKTVGPIESAMSNTTQSQPEIWEKFCDSNCVWTDHHPDCKLAQRTWVGLTEDDKVLIKHDANYNQFMTAGEYADRVQALTEARLKDKNT